VVLVSQARPKSQRGKIVILKIRKFSDVTIGLKLVQETTDKVVVIRDRLKAARDRPFEILERIGPVAYRLRLPEELSKELLEIMEREVKTLKRSKIPIVKVRWNSKRGPEFTWEREDHMKAKYPQLIDNAIVETNG
ncbi:hypothetical protein Tco_1224431, partial [Tanacetum coccineum]